MIPVAFSLLGLHAAAIANLFDATPPVQIHPDTIESIRRRLAG
jgi:hypothetical protein